MSISQTDLFSEVLRIDYLKSLIGITDDVEDEVLTQLAQSAQTEIGARLRPYVDDVPIAAESDEFHQAKTCAARYAMGMYYERFELLDKARYNFEIYEKKMIALISSIKAQKPDRTRAVFIPGKNPLDRTYQHANIDEYIVKEFD